MRLVAAVALIGLVAWIALYLSSSAILIGWTEPKVAPDANQASFTCRYWTGTRVFETQYWFSENGIFGKADCPRLVSL